MTANKSDFVTAGADKGANELRDLMGDVLRQIADTERQNATLLKSMQNRIETLNQGTKSVRAQVPAEYAPQFDRIEDGMSMIADRVAETSASLGSHHPTGHANTNAFRGFSHVPAFTTDHDDPFAVDGLLGGFPDEPQPVAKQPPKSAPHSGAYSSGNAASAQPRTAKNSQMGYANHASGQPVREPQPLRSAAGHHRPLSSSYPGDVDPFDVVESLPGNPADPWSSEGATALTDFYASGEPAFGTASQDDEGESFVSQHKRTTEARAPQALSFVAAGLDAPAPAVDKQWLEDRLAEIATRLERTLSDRHADPSLSHFDDRLAALEARIVEAMAHGQHNYAADPGQISEIEAQIQALATEFDAARTEIARLQVIEEQLSSLMRQFSDERMGAIVGRSLKNYAPAQSAVRDDTELQSIAMAAAEAAVARMASVSNSTAVTAGEADETVKRVSDLQDLMLGFIEERRQGDEQNAQVMDALQQAMLRVLDRLDEIEGVAVEGYEGS